MNTHDHVVEDFSHLPLQSRTDAIKLVGDAIRLKTALLSHLRRGPSPLPKDEVETLIDALDEFTKATDGKEY